MTRKDQKHKDRKQKAAGRSKRPLPWGWLLVGGSVVLFGGLATVDSWWPSASRNPLADVSPQEVARGEGLYRQFCKDCHGEGAQGENAMSPMGGGKPGGGYLAPALNERGHAHHHPPDVLFGYLRNGSPAEDSPMRTFRDRMSEADMRAVLGYVWSLWPPRMQQAYEQTHRH